MGSSKKCRLITATLVAAIAFLAAGSGHAQDSRFTLSTGAFNFDLSGTGTTPLIALSLDGNPAGNVILEGGVLLAFPRQQFGDRTKFIIPEAQVQYQWPLGRFAPFVGGGGGVAIDVRDEIFGGSDASLTLSGGGGVRVNLSDGMGLRGEFRLRGIGSNFSGSAAELRGGVFWRF